jgi:MFS family permease
MRRGRGFQGWRIVGAGFVVQAIQSTVLNQAYTHYVVLLKRDFGWSSTVFSMGWALNRLESGLLGPLQGWALDRFGARKVMRVGIVLMSVGFLLLSTMQTMWQFFAYFVITAIGGSLCGFLTVVTVTVRWFERKRSRALSLSQAGFAVGGALTPLLVFLLQRFGWRPTFVVAGVVSFAVIFPLTFFFVDRPSDVGQLPDGEPPQSQETEEGRARLAALPRFTAREALRTPAFWLISLGHASALLVVGAVLAHLSPYLVDELGYSLTTAGYVAGALPLVQLVGQLLGGYLGDRYSKRAICSIAMIGHVGGLLLLAQAESLWAIAAFVPLHGLAWGVRGPLMQSWRAEYFGSASFGQIMGISSLIIMVGQVGGPMLAGYLDDRTGSFKIGFRLVALIASLGLGFFAMAARPRPPRAAAVAGEAEGAVPVVGG